MRPRRLRMTAFGPYKESLELDFDELGEHQLFLITGPTGAGKSSIFEALYFALYGDVSQAGRNSRSLRSDFTEDPSLETEVDFSFDVAGKTYRIVRKPRQLVPYKTKAGLQEQGEEVSLTLAPEQAPLTNLREVAEKVNEIIGLNADQFKKIVMLPQGDFEDFLLAKSDEKRNILRHIFNTEPYAQAQRDAKAQSQEIYHKFEELERRFSQAWQQVEKKETREEAVSQGERLEALRELLRQKGADLRRLKKEQDESTRELEGLEEKHRLLSTHNDQIARLEQARSDLGALLAQDEAMTALQSRREKARQAQELLPLEKEAKSRAQGLASTEEELEDIQVRFKQQKTERFHAHKERESAEEALAASVDWSEQLERGKALLPQLKDYTHGQKRQMEAESALVQQEASLQKQLQELQDLQEALRNTEAHRRRYAEKSEGSKEAYENLLLQKQSLQKLEERQLQAQRYEDSMRRLVILKSKTKDANIDYLHKEKALSELRQQLAANQAALLARDLEEGKACPVCGSQHHPEKALWTADLGCESDAEEALRVASEAYHEARREEERLEDRAQDLSQQLLQGEAKADSIENLQEHFKSLTQKAREDKERLEKDWQGKNQADQVSSCLQRAQEQLEQKRLDLEEQIEPQQQDFHRANMEYELLTRQQSALLEKLPEELPELQSFETKLQKLQDELEEIHTRLEKARKNQQKVDLRFTEARTQLVNSSLLYSRSKKQARQAQSLFAEALSAAFAQQNDYDRAKEDIPQIEAWLQSLAQHRVKKESLQKSIADEESRLSDQERIDLAPLEAELKALKDRRQDVFARIVSLRKDQILRSRLYRSLKGLAEQSRVLEDAFADSQALAELLDGKNFLRMDFETYVLAAYFESVIGRANLRLQQMTAGRFQFVRRRDVGDKRRNQGLDLAMSDIHTGKDRDVVTLSGGERFKAALALALGLADVVAEASGGVEISTIFIDEGFGSLDENSLDQTLDSLFALQDHGRLVGIISHVGELKDRIEAQIQVTGGPEGSDAAIVIRP